MAEASISHRRRRICYWDPQSNAVSTNKINFEMHLKFLPNFDLSELRSLDDQSFHPCDLLIVNALSIPDDDFLIWLEGINKRVLTQNKIWTPAVLVSECKFGELSSEVHEFANNNWYFDLINPANMDSMPIRVANLLKIHDHLHELWRYEKELNTMQKQVSDIEQKLLEIMQKGH